jgi:superfamily II DNA or RNA helicase
VSQGISRLLPVKNCWVKKLSSSGEEVVGRVVDSVDRGDDVVVSVKWQKSGQVSVESLDNLRSGLKPHMEVQDVPNSRVRASLGEGVIQRVRTIGGKDQALVDFLQLGRQAWLPYENLRQIKGARHRFILGDTGPDDGAERFRLKSLAHALEMWNENTGSLSNLEIDPLPHQIHLVHHILASGHLNWLIADDVGLGKTIETGMLLAALKQRGHLKRVLLVTPAGLTKQWQEELNYKFKMGEFQIYGEDFMVNEPRHWKMFDFVIASIDRLKSPENLEQIQQAGKWDIVIFDEAHRLSRRQYGMKLDASQRFQLAAHLRRNTDALILLSATPHQGMQDKFQALLELLHPERKEEITTLALNPEIIGEMVFRNNKADVTDAEGNFLFKGKTTTSLPVHVSQEAKDFDDKLQDYLKKGYAAGAALGFKGNAIGFVMTVYRKLAASSVAAIHQALINRKARLEGEMLGGIKIEEIENQDQRFFGEWEEQLYTDAKEFFEGELELLDELIAEADGLRGDDRKLTGFIDQLIAEILGSNPSEKVLIFTEYRTTQAYIRGALETRFGEGSVELINGSMPHTQRRDAIARFEDSANFLISTEAGGEGINLQRKCHIMVNFDLPWNPMRLVQRIGRLYRYGQKKRVVVFNLHSPDTADEQVMELMYTRIDQVVDDLAGVSTEYNEQLRDDILGELADLLDVNQILEQATVEGITRTQERISEALERAKAATEKQRELFEHAAGFDPNETGSSLRIDHEHGVAFVVGMFSILGIEVVETTHEGRLFHIRLPEAVQHELGVERSRYEVTLDRDLVVNRQNTHMLDLDSFLMQYLLRKAKSYDFMGLSAVIENHSLKGGALLTSLLRWQNDQGSRMRQEYTAYWVKPSGDVQTNPDAFAEWLKTTAITGTLTPVREENQALFKQAELAADKRLEAVSNIHLHPENNQWVAGAWLV